MTTVIENVEFRTTAPKIKGSGLDDPLRKLEALQAALKQTQRPLAALSSAQAFKLPGLEVALVQLRELNAALRSAQTQLTRLSKIQGFNLSGRVTGVAAGGAAAPPYQAQTGAGASKLTPRAAMAAAAQTRARAGIGGVVDDGRGGLTDEAKRATNFERMETTAKTGQSGAISLQAALAQSDARTNERLERAAKKTASEKEASTAKERAAQQRAQRLTEADQAKRAANFERMQGTAAAAQQRRPTSVQALLAQEDAATNQRRRIEAQERQLVARGAQRVSTREDPLTQRRIGAVYQMQEGDTLHRWNVSYDKAGGSLQHLQKEMALTGRESQLLGGNFLRNTASMAAWTVSLGVLYGTVSLARTSFSRMIEQGAEMARLDHTFQKVGGSTEELASDVMHLAAANGRSTQEAISSAEQWARLGLTRMQINEGVKVSLMAANVANMGVGETTERLQSLMQTYGLRVGNLRTLLGELEYSTSHYNVTMSDMLNGLTQTAQAAKQAGLPLAELQGILAATIGATGLPGQRVGMAVKRVTMGLGDPVMQEKLRTQFRFETTTGGEQSKGMSQLLGDLYVKYTQLNNAQRQSLLFSVGGKLRGNELAAMLDNYVRAQVLAINSQLDLNSAEEENTKITATLKSQLAGVTSEWTRFMQIQGGHGPVQALSAITVAFRNLMALMNTPAGGMLMTGVLGLGTAAVARAGLAAVAVRGGAQRGFMGRTGGAILREAQSVSQAASNAVWGFAAGRTTAPGKALGGGLMAVDAAGNARLAKAGVQIREMRMGMASLNVMAGATAKSFALATLAVREFALPLLVIFGGIKLFNVAMEKSGASIAGMEEKMAGFNREGEKARAASSAFAEAGKALNTFEEALSGPGMRGDALKKMTGLLPDLMYLDEEDLGKRKGKQDTARKELDTMQKANDQAGIRKMLDEQSARYAKARLASLQQEYNVTQAQVAAADKKIKDLSLPGEKGTAYPGWNREKRQANIDQLKKEKLEAQGKGVQVLMEEHESMDEVWERRLQYDDKHLAALEREKLALTSIAEIFNQIETSNPMEKRAVDIASLGAQLEAIQMRRSQLTVEKENDFAGRQAVEDHQKDIQQQLDAARDRSRLLGEAGKMPGENAKDPLQQEYWRATGEIPQAGTAQGRHYKDWLEAQGASNDSNISSLQRSLDNPVSLAENSGPGALGIVSIDKQDQALIEQQRKMQAEKAALESEQHRKLTETRTQFGFGQQRSAMGASGQAYGIDESAKLLNTRQYLVGELVRLEAQKNKGAAEYGMLLKDHNLLYGNMLSLRQRHADVEREIHQLAIDTNKEFTRSFFGSGPAEMLRKLAAFKMAQGGGVSQGQFFSMGPGMREDYGKLNPQYNPDMISLKNERNRLNQPLGEMGGGDKQWGDKFDQWLTKFTGRLDTDMSGLPAEILKALAPESAAVASASKALDGLQTAAQAAAEGLQRIATIAMGIPLLAPQSGLQPIANPQGSGGWFAGKQN
jgi:TP901 family phage tail tape measure protein